MGTDRLRDGTVKRLTDRGRFSGRPRIHLKAGPVVRRPQTPPPPPGKPGSGVRRRRAESRLEMGMKYTAIIYK